MLENKGSLFSNRRYAFSVSELSPQAFEVVRFDGEEALSTLYRFELLLASSDSDINERALIGKTAQFSLNDGVEGGQPTVYRGLVQSFTYQYQTSGWTFYRVTLVPRMWLLNTFYLSEIYLDKTRQELFTTIMENAGLTRDDFAMRFKDENAVYPKRDYICQYRESYFTFIARWAERLGTYWWYEEDEGREKVVFSDTRMAHKDEVLLLHYQAPGELDAVAGRKRRLQRLELEAGNLPRQIVIRDHSAQRASMEIMGTATVDPNGSGEVHIFGEHLMSNEEASQVARLRAEGKRCRGDIYRGSSTATGVRCGGFIQVQDHPRQRFNQRYLVTAVKHRGSQAGVLLEGLRIPIEGEANRTADFYLAEITAIPADVQFRPEIKHPWPRIVGTLNAFVDAEGSGKYAELNDKGEYKIQVPFDITQKNAQRGSAWIRMATPYAGSDHGMHFPLHKGTEVVLSFINGDPDQPIILGAIPNSMNPNVVNNANQMQSRIHTAGGNEITLHDEEGKQHMLFKTPNANTFMRIGAPAKSSQSFVGDSSSRQQWQQSLQARLPWQGMQQMWQGSPETRFPLRQQQQQTFDITDYATATNDASGYQSDIWINTDSGNFGVTTGSTTPTAPTDGISLTTYGDTAASGANITLTSSAGDITLNASNGSVTQYAKTSSTTVEHTANTFFWGEETKTCLGYVGNFYGGLVTNVYAGAYSNYYLIKTDFSTLKVDMTSFKKEQIGGELKTVGWFAKQTGTKVVTTGTKVDTAGTKVVTTETKVDTTETKLDTTETKLDTTATKLDTTEVKLEAAETKLQQSEVVLSDNSAVIEELEALVSRADVAAKYGVNIFM